MKVTTEGKRKCVKVCSIWWWNTWNTRYWLWLNIWILDLFCAKHLYTSHSCSCFGMFWQGTSVFSKYYITDSFFFLLILSRNGEMIAVHPKSSIWLSCHVPQLWCECFQDAMNMCCKCSLHSGGSLWGLSLCLNSAGKGTHPSFPTGCMAKMKLKWQ